MKYSEDYLRRLCNHEIIGDFPPFDTADRQEVISYIKKMVGRLTNNYLLSIDADFKSYGSGYASYVPVKISKRDKSNVKITTEGTRHTEWVTGILLYISKHSPHWYYGGTEWTDNYEHDQWISGSSGFLMPDHDVDPDPAQWQFRLIEIEQTMLEFGYRSLYRQFLTPSLWFDIKIPAVLSNPPYTVFDCFFHWED